MAKTQLGKVAIVPRGAYDASATYEPLDVVSYNGGSYMARQQSTGITPVEGESWQDMVSVTREGVYKASGMYELIETITTTEELEVIERTQEPDGTPYNFDTCKVLFKTHKDHNCYVNVWYDNSDNNQTIRSYLRLSNGTLNARYGNSMVEAYKEHGVWRVRQYEYLDGYTVYNQSFRVNIQENVSSYYGVMYTEGRETIQYLKISANKTTELIPADTVIWIYAIRA